MEKIDSTVLCSIAGHACERLLSVFVQRERESHDTEDIQFAVVEPLASWMG